MLLSSSSNLPSSLILLSLLLLPFPSVESDSPAIRSSHRRTSTPSTSESTPPLTSRPSVSSPSSLLNALRSSFADASHVLLFFFSYTDSMDVQAHPKHRGMDRLEKLAFVVSNRSTSICWIDLVLLGLPSLYIHPSHSSFMCRDPTRVLVKENGIFDALKSLERNFSRASIWLPTDQPSFHSRGHLQTIEFTLAPNYPASLNH